MSNDIVSTEDEALPPSFMRQEALAAQQNMEDSAKPYLHICQSKSPEVEVDEVAKAGDFFIRNADINLGDSVQVVILASQKHWVNWVKQGDMKVIAWDYPADRVPAELRSDCVWRADPDGGDDLPPVANETYKCALMVIKDGEIDTDVGLFTANFDRTAVKPIREALKIIAKDNRKGWHPASVVFTMSTTKRQKGKNVWMALSLEKAGHIVDEGVYNTLSGLYNRAQASRGTQSTLPAPETPERDATVVSDAKKVDELKSAFGAKDGIDEYAATLPEEEPPF